MIREGKGRISPPRIAIALSRADMRLLRDKSSERTRYRAYSRRPDAWGRGFNPNAVLLGCIGEQALAAYLDPTGDARLSADLRLLPNGDGGRDIVVAGLRSQVKTRGKDYGETLIRRIDDGGALRPLSCDAIVSALWDGSLYKDGSSTAWLLGWEWAERVISGGRTKPSPSREARHWNLTLEDRELRPMSDLRLEIACRKERVS